MPRHSKRFRAAAAKIEHGKRYELSDAVELLK
jgi:ribosomal protein L1